MDRQELEAYLQEIQVLQTGHFKLTSGLHSAHYMQCAKIFEEPKKANVLLDLLAEKIPSQVETVVAPAIGGITIGYALAAKLEKRCLFAEREEGSMRFRRGFQLHEGEKVLLVEDVVTTGGSVHEVIALVKKAKASLVAVASIVDRSGGRADFGVPFISLLPMDIKAFKEEDCPLCKEGVPLYKPGSRT